MRVHLHESPGRDVETVVLGDTGDPSHLGGTSFLEPERGEDLEEPLSPFGPDQQIQVVLARQGTVQRFVALEVAVGDVGGLQLHAERHHEIERPLIIGHRRGGRHARRGAIRVGELSSRCPAHPLPPQLDRSRARPVRDSQRSRWER